MYQVFDNGKLAIAINFGIPIGFGWDNATFSTFLEAQSYARKWLGTYSQYTPIMPNQSIDYSGLGDAIEIRKSYHSTRLFGYSVCKKCGMAYEIMEPLDTRQTKCPKCRDGDLEFRRM